MSDKAFPRRIALKSIVTFGSAAVLLGATGAARADKNAGVRTALKYQDTPSGANQCSGCTQFTPGKTAKDKGGCKVIPGDNEIAPTGWCAAYVAAKK